MKYILYFLFAAIVVAAVSTGVHLYKVAARNKKEMAQFGGERLLLNKKFGKVLVVYYSLSGNTKAVAEAIRDKTGADMFEIKTVSEIKQNPMLHLAVRDQLKTGKYPELAGELPDFSKYDMIFVGAPVWWYTVATPALSFLERADFQGKAVVPFSTQGRNAGTYFEDFAKKVKNARLLKSESFNNLPKEYDSAVENKIIAWLNGL